MSTIQTGTTGHVYCTLPTSANSGIERSIPRFSGLSDETTVEDAGLIPVTNALSSIKFYFSPLSHLIFSSPEHAQGELLEYSDVHRTCGRPRCPSVNFLLVYTPEGTVPIGST